MKALIFLLAQGDEIRGVLWGAGVVCSLISFFCAIALSLCLVSPKRFVIIVCLAFSFCAASSLIPSSETAAAMLRIELLSLPPAERASIEALIAQSLKESE
jgi:hypothetical protein